MLPTLTAQAQARAHTVTLDRAVFVAARDIQRVTEGRLKGFAEASNLWNAIMKDGVVQASELHLLQLILAGPGEIRLVARATPAWTEDDVMFRNYWSTGRGVAGLPAPLDYLRRKVALAELDLDAGAAQPTAQR